jgi:hypothetical protein
MRVPIGPEYVQTILAVAARDPSIGRVLREICALEGAARAAALDLVAAHCAARDAPRDLFVCIAALRQDEVARQIAEGLGPAG